MAVIKSQEKKRFPHEQEFPRNINKEVHGKNKAIRPKEARWAFRLPKKVSQSVQKQRGRPRQKKRPQICIFSEQKQ